MFLLLVYSIRNKRCTLLVSCHGEFNNLYHTIILGHGECGFNLNAIVLLSFMMNFMDHNFKVALM